MGRAHVRRPMRPSGVDEREGLVRRVSSETSRLVRSRFASVATKLRRPGQADQAGRPGPKSPGRSGVSQHPARRGPPSERVKNPRPEGFRITAPREALELRRNGTHNCKSSGRGPGASHPSHPIAASARERETAPAKGPLSRLRRQLPQRGSISAVRRPVIRSSPSGGGGPKGRRGPAAPAASWSPRTSRCCRWRSRPPRRRGPNCGPSRSSGR